MRRPIARDQNQRKRAVGSQVANWVNFVNLAELRPLIWFDASDSSTITESSGSVSQWNDKSGNGYNVTQATGINQPSLMIGDQNGLSTIFFDGSNDRLSNAVFPTTAQPYTVVALFRWASATNNYRLFSASNNVQIFIINNKFSPFAGALTGPGANETTNAGCRIVTFNGASSRFYLDSTPFVTLNPGTNSAAAPFTLGARADNTLFGSLYLFEFALFNRLLNDSEVASVVSYSRRKWGTPL